MAKLLLSVYLGVLLIVALALILRGTHCTKTPEFISSLVRWKTSEDIEQIQKDIRDPDKSVPAEKLKMVGKYYVKQTKKFKSSTVALADLENFIENMQLLEKRYPSLNLTDLGLPDSWRSLLSLWNSALDCEQEGVVSQVAKYTLKGEEKYYDFALSRFKYHLKECHYEDHFGKTVQNIEQKSTGPWNWKEYPTLSSYLADRCWPLLKYYQVNMIVGLTKLLPAIKELSAAERFSETNYCTVKTGANLLVLVQSLRNCSRPQKIITDCLKPYLETCHHEKSFKEIITSIEKITRKARFSIKYPTLDTYFLKEFTRFSPDSDLETVFGTFLEEMRGINGGVDCKEQWSGNFIERINIDSTYRAKKSPELTRIHFALYLAKCGFEDSFNKAIASIKQTAHGNWNSVKLPTFDSYLESHIVAVDWKTDVSEQKQLFKRVSSIFKELSVLDVTSQEIFCTEEFQTKLLGWLVNSEKYPGLKGLINGYFALYLDKCGLGKGFDIGNRYDGQIWRAPSNEYATLHRSIIKSFSEQSDKNELVQKLTQILSAIKEIQTIKSISVETGCTKKLETILVNGLVDSRDYEDLYHPIKNGLRSYLKKCSLLSRFDEKMRKRHLYDPEDLVVYLYRTYIKVEEYSGDRKEAILCFIEVVKTSANWADALKC